MLVAISEDEAYRGGVRAAQDYIPELEIDMMQKQIIDLYEN